MPRSQEEVGEEDDGFLMTFVWDAGRKTSFLLVHDARTMGLVAEVDVRARVPFGFHGRGRGRRRCGRHVVWGGMGMGMAKAC